MIRINLLPFKAAQKMEQLRGQLAVLVLCLLLVAIGCGVFYTSQQARIDAEKESIAAKEDEMLRLRKIIGEVRQFKKLQEELREKLDILDRLKKGKTGPVHLLDELSRAVSDELWITSFKEAGGNVSLAGVGLNEASVAQFLRDLEASPYYRNVELKVVEQTTQSGLKMQKFSVTCGTEAPSK